MLMRSDAPAILKEIPLNKDGKLWVGGFSLDDELSRLILLRIVSGDLQDDNNGRPWNAFVHGKDGKVLRDARVFKALFVAGYGMTGFKHEKDFTAAYALLAEEQKEHPDNWRAPTTEWMLREPRTAGRRNACVNRRIARCVRKEGSRATRKPSRAL